MAACKMGSPADQEPPQNFKIDAVQDALDETDRNEKEDHDLEGDLIMDSRGSEESTRSNETENSIEKASSIEPINRTNGVSNQTPDQTSDQNDSDQIEQANQQTDDQTKQPNSPGPGDDQRPEDAIVDQNFRFSLGDELVLEDEPRSDEHLDEQQLNIDKQKVLNHPLFKLLGECVFASNLCAICSARTGDLHEVQKVCNDWVLQS